MTTIDNKVKLIDMTWPEIKTSIENGFDRVVFSLGSTEQHGPHLPLKTDTLIGEEVAYRFAKKLGNTLQAPTINVGYSKHHLAFAGSVSLSEDTLKAVICDYLDSLIKHGFKTIILLPYHGGNYASSQECIELYTKKHPELKIVGYTDLLGLEHIINDHAGHDETSLVMATSEAEVRTDKFEPGYSGKIDEDAINTIFEKGMPALTSNGILGDPKGASVENGNDIYARYVDFLVEKVLEQL
ncbi:creatininase family protein [bacterium]|nr:creatininase family protein [bacterium]